MEEEGISMTHDELKQQLAHLDMQLTALRGHL